MRKVIKLDLTTQSIDAAIQAVNEYKKWIEEKSKELLEELVRLGYEISTFNFTWAAYDGTNDVSVTWETRGENRVAVVATGNAVLFIEFGTGITFPDDHPLAADNGMIRGEYGKGYGGNPAGWNYKGDPGTYGVVEKNGSVHTYGNPANMSMYLTMRDLERDFAEIARRVFNG